MIEEGKQDSVALTQNLARRSIIKNNMKQNMEIQNSNTQVQQLQLASKLLKKKEAGISPSETPTNAYNIADDLRNVVDEE